MDISKLDEWQGVTPQLVTDWLLKNGWMQTKPRWWERGEDAFTFDSATFDQLWFWTHALAAIYTNGNVQALIREINPRMRKGWPSGEALAMHDRWIVSKPEGVVIMCRWRPPYMVNAAGGGDLALREQCEHWSFWPCDANGNKVRWPEKDGVML